MWTLHWLLLLYYQGMYSSFSFFFKVPFMCLYLLIKACTALRCDTVSRCLDSTTREKCAALNGQFQVGGAVCGRNFCSMLFYLAFHPSFINIIITAQVCRPACGNNVCGPDGCGGSCGDCNKGQFCGQGICQRMFYSILCYYSFY